MDEDDARLFVLCPIPMFVMTWISVSTEKNSLRFLLGLEFWGAGGNTVNLG